MTFRKTILLLTLFLAGVLPCLLPSKAEAQKQGSWISASYSCRTRSCLDTRSKDALRADRAKDLIRRGLAKRKPKPFKLELKLRLRDFRGKLYENQSSAEIHSQSVIYDGFGIGESKLKFKTRSVQYSITYESKTTTRDFSYTFGEDWTLTLGASLPYSGNAKVRFLEHTYQSDQVTGGGYFIGMGLRISIFEVLLRKTSLETTYKDLTRSGGVPLGNDLKMKMERYLLGFGLSFK